MALYLTIILQVFGVQAAIDHSIGYFPADISPGLKSIGIEPFLSEKAAKSVLRVRDSKNQELKLYLYPVYYKGEPLFAWFRVQGKINNGGIRWFAIQAESKESKHSVGEFFHPEFISDKSSCFSSLTYSSVPSDPEKLTKYNFLPSLYSPNPSVTVPVGFVFKTENPSSFPSEINLLWRMSMSLCGFDDKNPVLFRGYALNHDDSTGLVTAETPEILYKDFLYGAHDPKPPKNADLSCNSQQMPQWVEGVTNTMNLKDASSTCSDALKDRPYDHFYGRCNIYRNSSKPSEVYECKGNNKFYSSLPAQTAATARAGSLTPDLIFCIGPNSTCTGIYEILEAKGIATTSYLGSVIMEAREAHGILMVIVTFFLIPVTSFTTRYFKETFLTRRVLHNHIWYCVHLVGILHAFIGTVTSMFVATRAGSIYGTNRDNKALIHRIFGWVSVGCFMLLILQNGLRLTCRIPRMLCIFCHFLLATLVYYGFIAVCILSCYIPGSPSSLRPIREDIDLETVTFLALFWVFFDIVMHAVMMHFIERSDWEMDLAGPRFYICNRYLGFFFFPVLPIDTEEDAPGRLFREYMQAAYTIVAFGNTLIISVIIGTHPDVMFLGHMELTHNMQGHLLDPDVLPVIQTNV